MKVSGPVSLELSADSGLLRVNPGPDGSVLVRGILRSTPSWFPWGDSDERLRHFEQNPPVEQNGNEIRAGGEARGRSLGGLTLLLDVTTPVNTRVRAHGDHTDIRVSGVRGPVDCETSSGGVEISGVDAPVRVSADHGSIQVRGVTGRVDLEADHGDIEALDIAGAIDVSADSGVIRISQTVAAPIHAKADHGSIAIKLAPTGGYDVRVRTDHGSISVPPMEARPGCPWNEAEGRIRGGGARVDVETDHGSVDIE